MKYIKTYEDQYSKFFKVNSYVKLKCLPNYFEPEDDYDNDLYAKIIEIEAKLEDIFTFKLSNGQILYANVYIIRRFLNYDEIQDYEMKINTKKYNL